jgi:hypothetical protein
MRGACNGRRSCAGHALTKQRVGPLHAGMARSTPHDEGWDQASRIAAFAIGLDLVSKDEAIGAP